MALSNEDVARLTRPMRELRVKELVEEAHDLLSIAIRDHILQDGRDVAAVAILFSGGNDSTILAHLFRTRADYAAHCNTTIGIEQTRQFVRDICAAWGLGLIERTPPKESDHYRALVLDQGFPGPGHHFKMFQRLKERALRQVQRELVTNPRKERVVFIAGRRRQESKRRANIPDMERRGSVVYVSPLVNWTKMDMNTYRLMMGDVPVNEVSDLIHMSGECLCGSFAHPGERDEVSHWFPGVFEEIAELEAEIANRDDIPEHRRKWGWGADPQARNATPKGAASKTGLMCSSCDDRFSTDIM
ncbi:MAG: phosphoadenosine phosphosulfate reductase domain-containing protein [Mycobacteriaceae bacterium]